jgi:putative membrane protein
MNIRWAGAVLAVLPFTLVAQDTSTPKMDQGAKKMMKSHDTAFAMEAARGGMAEVEMGKLAADKADNADVKAFGQQMADDHTKANDKLKEVAEKQNLTLPTTITAKQQAMYDMLKTKSGADFDKAYVDAMVKDHEQDVKAFQREANNGKDEQIKAFASETLPVLQGHLEKIKSIQSKMGG